MLQLILVNHSNHCCANSLISALLWVSSQDSAGLLVRNTSRRRLLQWLVASPRRLNSGVSVSGNN